jgi:benzoylformate decarboxylase
VTVRMAVLDFLRRAGATTVFGNPGSTELRFLRDWPDDFRYVLGLQESVVIGMAAGYAIGTGRAAVAGVHSAGGLGHGLGAVVNAYRDRVPLVIFAGQQTREMLIARPFLGADEPASFPRPYVKWSGQPERAEDVPVAFAEAYRVAMTPPRGPVFLSVPEDDWDRPAALVPHRDVHAGFGPEPGAIREVADALNGARSPVLIAGAAVDDDGAQELLVELAERAWAPVWSEPLPARSSFPERHRLFRGYLPPVRDRIASLLAGHDVVVAIGAQLFKYHVDSPGPFLPDGTRGYHLDCDASAAAWTPAGTSVLTTVRTGTAALLDLVEKRTRPDPPPRTPLPAVPVRDPIAPGLVFDTLRSLVPPDAVVVEEAPSHRDEFHERFPILRPGGFLTTGNGVLGWGLPLAVGRALAGPGERVVCVVGDGASMYAIQALWTAARHRVPVTFVVLNNGGYGAVRGLGRRLGVPEPVGCDLDGIDFVTVAAGLGCPGEQVPSAAALAPALTRGLRGSGPYVVEVAVAPETNPLY